MHRRVTNTEGAATKNTIK